MANYDLEQVQLELSEIKEKLYNYLSGSYQRDPDGPEEAAKKTFKYLGDVVDLIIKKREFKIQFSSGGSTLWHSRVLSLLATWIDIEHRYSLLLAGELDNLDATED